MGHHRDPPAGLDVGRYRCPADLARLLVEDRLAACVNVLECGSTDRWDGEIHEDPDAVLLVKTTDAVFDRLVERVVDTSPYEVPCVERFDELDAFADWRATRSNSPPLSGIARIALRLLSFRAGGTSGDARLSQPEAY